MSRPLALLLPDLRVGGAERVVVALAGAWRQQGMPVDVVLLRREGDLLDALDPSIRVFDLEAARFRSAFLPLAGYLRRERPTAVLANLWPLTVIAPFVARAVRYRGRTVVAEHGLLARGFAGRGRLHAAGLRASLRLAYPRADARVAVSAGVADHLAQLSGLARDRFTVIHNPAATGRDHTADAMPVLLGALSPPRILAVGTLKPAKRFDLLLDAFARVARRRVASLCILGEGAERAALEAQARRLGIAERVALPGFVGEVGAWYAHADLLALTSDHEGFGNVIVEALEQGTPVVSTDCEAGPREILAGGRYGRLVPVGDAAAFAAALESALRNDVVDRAALKRRAADFSAARAAAAYLDVLVPGGCVRGSGKGAACAPSNR